MLETTTKKIQEIGKTIGGKAQELSELAKLNVKLATEEKVIEELYTNLGKAVYAVEKDAEECAYADSVKAITDKLAEIAKIKADICGIRGVTTCPNCGADVPFENDFCGKCGTKVEKPVKEEPVEEEVTEESVVTEEINEAKDSAENEASEE